MDRNTWTQMMSESLTPHLDRGFWGVEGHPQTYPCNSHGRVQVDCDCPELVEWPAIAQDEGDCECFPGWTGPLCMHVDIEFHLRADAERQAKLPQPVINKNEAHWCQSFGTCSEPCWECLYHSCPTEAYDRFPYRAFNAGSLGGVPARENSTVVWLPAGTYGRVPDVVAFEFPTHGHAISVGYVAKTTGRTTTVGW